MQENEVRKETCETCKYFARGYTYNRECRRHAPVINQFDSSPSNPLFPLVYENFYCGDYELKNTYE